MPTTKSPRLVQDSNKQLSKEVTIMVEKKEELLYDD
eukprot:CAMPEP_0185614138 /NCGR_PEP_ID=MMETSP0436-20130131/30351_1 /TAXON_ID=626734 ORGANISM="Favella taraikaensis, Strain Fe Narragansett Bay" /NCGR_SAMPLE_ID=MMETSP0436 /ASSEMBLY_ACC=CAM_ASM_000390 /LENGTH=35 /DNA_ID= /DNA_START= /DNA_END= /DNA_ORIENTATION=